MLHELPLEILEILIGHLPTASAVINLSLANRKLHNQISADKYALLRCFVQNRFPSIRIPPLWREAAVALTARSRAWERRAFIARQCDPPIDDVARVRSGHKFGYIPVIDSYETWLDSSWAGKIEVLAWGAAGRLRLRTTRNGSHSWSSWRTANDHAPQQDIMDIKLLRPEQNQNPTGETIIIRRANNEIVKVESTPKQDVFVQKSILAPDLHPLHCMDLNTSPDPFLAVCNRDSLILFDVKSNEEAIQPAHVLQLERKFHYKHRTRCARFLSEHTLAMGMQFLEGRTRAPIQIYNINPSGITESPFSATYSIDAVAAPTSGRGCSNCITPLDEISALVGRPGEVFLSGWNDGVVRLYDLRTPMSPRSEYFDLVDDGQILSLLPTGHERFLAGSHQNACLKTFDLRMSGGHAYSYTNVSANSPQSKSQNPVDVQSTAATNILYRPSPQTRRDINVFLAIPVGNPPCPGRNQNCDRGGYLDRESPRYRGSIYSLSSPSPSSTAVYVGIESHVVQLDFVSTDDVESNKVQGIVSDHPPDILSLSCYERPRPGHELTDAVLLRKQSEWGNGKKFESGLGEAEDGWDKRWRLPTCDRPRPGGRSEWQTALNR